MSFTKRNVENLIFSKEFGNHLDQVQYSESMKSILYLRSYAEVRERNSEEKSDDSKKHSKGEEGEDEEEGVEAVEEAIGHKLLQFSVVGQNKYCTRFKIHPNLGMRMNVYIFSRLVVYISWSSSSP